MSDIRNIYYARKCLVLETFCFLYKKLLLKITAYRHFVSDNRNIEFVSIGS